MDLPNPTDRGVSAGVLVRLRNHKRQYEKQPPEAWTVRRVLRDVRTPSGWLVELFDGAGSLGVDSSCVESIKYLDEYWDDDIPF